MGLENLQSIHSEGIGNKSQIGGRHGRGGTAHIETHSLKDDINKISQTPVKKTAKISKPPILPRKEAG